MKKYFFLILTIVFIGTSQNTVAQKKAKLKDFNALNTFEANEWLTGNFDISNAFVEIYNTHGSKKQFKKQLINFAGFDLDKIYWLATYSNDDYYNEIKDENLSFELYKYGIAISKNAEENEQIRFLYVVGKAYYFKGEKEKSLEYLIPAYKLSQKHPGNVPTWNSLEEAEEISAFIKRNL
ncbi:MAG: hypothetical protein ACPGR5_02350 [Chitinophagales bacterium]|mgnify:CR=1 FL=1